MTNEREERVEEFHRAFGADIAVVPSVRALQLRRNLIAEESAELLAELDTAINHLSQGEEVPKEVYVNMLKELADVQVVLSGTAVALAPLRKFNEAFIRVNESNMSKLGEDGKFIGLSEQIDPLKKSKDYLFEDTKKPPQIVKGAKSDSVLTDGMMAIARKAAGLPETPTTEQ